MDRRAFLQISAAAPAAAQMFPPALFQPTSVAFAYDGVFSSAAEQARLMAKLATEHKADVDQYGHGGSVTALEQEMATILGKERAIFLPTGTMANRLALQALVGERRRVLVSRESHTYNDEGDGPQRLSGLSLVPLAPGRATFAVDDIEAEVRRFQGGPPPPPIGAIGIECPVRRQDGRLFDYAEMKRISLYAREHNIRLHLDGARLQIACAYSGVSPAQYGAVVDTVYVSLYKHLSAPGGAILAGSGRVIEEVARLRHGSGGLLWTAWPQATIALHYLNGFAERFGEAVRRAEQFFELLGNDARFRLERLADGTNISLLHVTTSDVAAWTKRLIGHGIIVLPPRAGVLSVRLHTNETLLRRSPEEIAGVFNAALM